MLDYKKETVTTSMEIVVSNDDGIMSGALWALAGELCRRGSVTVVAPDGERSAIGTAVTLFQPLHARSISPPVDGVTAYAVDGSPADCVILALGRLVTARVDMVVTGINPNLNLGEDVHISGTVGGALQGYFRGLPALAISAPPGSQTGIENAAIVAGMIVSLLADGPPVRIFLNINVPGCPLKEIAGVRITRLARASHINSVEEENQGGQRQYRLVRSRLPEVRDRGTDIEAIAEGYISLTPLYTSLLDRPPQRLLQKLCHDLWVELRPRK